MDTTTIIIISAVGFLLSIWIWHTIIKSAVASGIKEAGQDINKKPLPPATQSNDPWTAKQKDLQQRYDRGEITFEEYKEGFKTVK